VITESILPTIFHYKITSFIINKTRFLNNKEGGKVMDKEKERCKN
jgi:hypothetical protein